MNVTLKNLPVLKLGDLLRRRKMTLLQFIKESGVQAYGSLVERCTAMGVQPPSEEEYTATVPVPTSTSQQDGVIVLEPLPVIDEMTGRQIDVEAPVTNPGIEVITDVVAVDEPTEGSQKKRNKKKEKLQED